MENCEICKLPLTYEDTVNRKPTDYVVTCNVCRDTKEFKTLGRSKASACQWYWENIQKRKIILINIITKLNFKTTNR
jgi:hypothetical protein